MAEAAVMKIREFASSLTKDEMKLTVLEDVLFSQCRLDPVDADYDEKMHVLRPSTSDRAQKPPNAGVCDSPQQFARRYAEWSKANPDGACVVHFCRILRSSQPSSDGWRWHKHGEYVGEFAWKKAGIEYLFEANGRHKRPRIDKQYMFSRKGSFVDAGCALDTQRDKPLPKFAVGVLGDAIVKALQQEQEAAAKTLVVDQEPQYSSYVLSEGVLKAV